MNRVQKYLLIASFSIAFADSMLLPLYSIFVNKIGGSLIDAGTGYALFSILIGVVTIITSKIEWFSRNLKLVMFVGFVIATLGDFCYILVTDYIELFIVQMINGVAVGLLNSAWETLYTGSINKGSEYKAWTFWGGGENISIGVAALVGSITVTLFGFNTLFISMTVINIITVYCAFIVYRIK